MDLSQVFTPQQIAVLDQQVATNLVYMVAWHTIMIKVIDDFCKNYWSLPWKCRY